MGKSGGGGASIRPSGPAPRSGGRGGDSSAGAMRSQSFLKGLASEMRRITWPSRREWVGATVLTLALVIGVGLFTYLVDELCTYLFGLVHS